MTEWLGSGTGGCPSGGTNAQSGPVGYHGEEIASIPDWYFDMMYKQYGAQMSPLLQQMGYKVKPNTDLDPSKNYTDWATFFKADGLDYKGPGFPNTAILPVQHPNGCSELTQDVWDYLSRGLAVPPDIEMAMKKVCHIQ